MTGHKSEAGQGIEAGVEGVTVRMGHAAFAAALAGTPPPVAWIERDTVVWLADETGWIAALRMGDAARPEAADAIAAIRRRGARVHLLSGDEPGVVERTAQALGIALARSRATPEDKRGYVRELQRRGARVAMIGDGINDAPVLAQADVSVAMGGGADLAQVRADAVLLSDSLADLAAATHTARRARRVIRQNLGWALAYNAIAVPLAFAGWVTPLVAGIGMSASSLVVVANALRLRR